MERIRKAKEILDRGWRYCRNSRGRLGYWLVVIAGSACIVGCSHLKTGLATSAIVGATTALVPAAIVAPAVLGGVTAATVSAITAGSRTKGEPINVTADTVIQEAPANFWTLLGQLIEMGGWALILIIVVPMVFSWLMPGPIQFKGKKKNGS
jgi:hypothetical protein